MNNLFNIDVLEICFLNIPKGKNTAKIKPGDILNQLNQNKVNGKKRTISNIRKAIKIIFPIYKNCKTNTKTFKISRRAAYDFLKRNEILLRPAEHAEESIFSNALK